MLAQHGFPAERLFPVNPKYAELNGQRVYPSIADVPGPVDLALVAVPATLGAGRHPGVRTRRVCGTR